MPIKANDSSPGGIDSEIVVSAVFKLLSHHRRRFIIQYLSTQAGTTPVSGVADQIALLEGEHTSDNYERICTDLIHTHLPMLADAGAIKYDHDREVVKLHARGREMLSYLDPVTAD